MGYEYNEQEYKLVVDTYRSILKIISESTCPPIVLSKAVGSAMAALAHHYYKDKKHEALQHMITLTQDSADLMFANMKKNNEMMSENDFLEALE